MIRDLVGRLSIVQSALTALWLVMAVVLSLAFAESAARAIQFSTLRLSDAARDASLAGFDLKQQKKSPQVIAQAIVLTASEHGVAAAVFDSTGRRIAGDSSISSAPPGGLAGLPGLRVFTGGFGPGGPMRGIGPPIPPGLKGSPPLPGPANGQLMPPPLMMPGGAGGPVATESYRVPLVVGEGSDSMFVQLPDGYVVMRASESPIARVARVYLIAIAVLLALATASTWLLNRWLIGQRLAAVQTIESALQDLARGDPSRLRVMEAGNAGSPIVANFNAAAERLSSALSRQSAAEANMRQFIAEAGHELRTPLAVIMGFVEVLRGGAIADAAVADRILRSVDVEGERLRGLIDKLLYLAKLDAVPTDPHVTVDVGAIAYEVAESLRPLAADFQPGVWAEPHLLVSASATEVRTVVSNLLDNAVKYAPAAAKRVVVRGANGWVEIAVSDEGPGMDATLKARAFDLFTRGDDRGAVTGSGLGLAIVKRIADRLGGEVTLESELGKGTRVVVRLPRAVDAVPRS